MCLKENPQQFAGFEKKKPTSRDLMDIVPDRYINNIGASLGAKRFTLVQAPRLLLETTAKIELQRVLVKALSCIGQETVFVRAGHIDQLLL